MWFDVEVLPPSRANILLHCLRGNEHFYYIGKWIKGSGFIIRDRKMGVLITHWMPLPAPPTADTVEGANLQPLTQAVRQP